MDLVGILGGTGFHQVAVELVGGAVVDGGQVGLGQGHVIQLAGLEQLVGHVAALHHLNGHGVEALHTIRVPVVGVGGQHLFILVNVGGDGIGAGVPQVLPGDALVAFHADFLNQLGGQGVQAVVGGHGGEVGQGVHALVGDGLVVGRGNLHHLSELVGDGQGLGGFLTLLLGQLLGVGIVLGGASNHLHGHGGVGGSVLGEVQHPFQAGQPVLGDHIGLHVAVLVNPGHAVVEHERPGLAAVGGGPFLGSVANQGALGVVGQQAVDAVDQHVQVVGQLRGVDVEGFHLTGSGFVAAQVGDFSRACGGDGGHRQHHGQRQHEGQKFLHAVSSLKNRKSKAGASRLLFLICILSTA